jgi:hypothetical protein
MFPKLSITHQFYFSGEMSESELILAAYVAHSGLAIDMHRLATSR